MAPTGSAEPLPMERETLSEMDEETYSLFLRYHFATCERPDLIGYSNHTLDIFQAILLTLAHNYHKRMQSCLLPFRIILFIFRAQN